MPNAVTVVFNADTGQYVAGVDAATGAVTKQGQAVADAKNKILSALKDQTAAAKTAGASAEELTRIQAKAAEGLANVTETNANKVIAALDRISEKRKRVALELQNLPNVPLPTETHGDEITNKQRASAVLRGGGIRAGESFLTQFDMFNKLSTMVFPALGLGVLVKEAWEGVEAFKAMYETAKKLPEALRDAFTDFNAPLVLGVDSLRKANDELEITNAHLEHKSADVPDAALKIDMIRIAADNAATAARKAFGDIKKLLSENKSGFAAFALTGSISTGPVSEEVNKRMGEINRLQLDNRDALRSGKDTPEAAATRAQALTQKMQELQAWAHTTRTDLQSFDRHDGKLDSNLNILSGVEDYSGNALDEEAERKRNQADSAQQKSDQDQAKKDEAAKAAKRAAAEAQRKAQEEARKADQKRYDSFKTSEDVLKEYLPPEDVARDWAEFAKTFKAGSDKANEAVREAAAATMAADRAGRDAQKRAAEKNERDQRSAWDMDHDGWVTAAHRTAQDEADYWSIRALEATRGSENERAAWSKATQATLESQRQAQEAARARSKAALEAGTQRTSYEEASVAIDEQTGRISKQDAALQLANIHAEEYRQKMADLRLELGRQKELDPNSAATVNAQAGVDKADADRKVQVMQDAARMAAESWQGALKNANALWIQDAQDTAKQVAQFYGEALDGVNHNLVQAMEGRHGKTNWKGLGKNLAEEGSMTLLKRAEAPLLGALGLSKADGSKGNPLHVILEGGAAMMGGMGQTAQSIVAGFPGASGLSSALSGGIGSLLSAIPGVSLLSGLFGGHRALGGGVKAGVSYDVGEMGRETFTPATDGYITPNNRTGGGAPTYNIAVANGVTPEQMHQHVRAALQEAHPQLVASAVRAVSANNSRNPSSVR